MTIEQIHAVLGFAAVVLGAIGVGIFGILAVGAYGALRDARGLMKTVGTRVDDLSGDAVQILGTVRRLSRGLEGGDRDVAELMTAVGEAAAALRRMAGWANLGSAIGSAVGPATAAFVTTLCQDSAPADAAYPSEPEAENDTAGQPVERPVS